MAILTKYISFYNINEENELMVNALSGAIDIIDSETKSIIHKFSEQDNIKALNAREKNIYDSLKKRGYIFEDRNHELNEMKRQMKIHEYLCDISVIHVICPTMFCNMNCVYCFEPSKVRNQQKVISDNQCQSICDFIYKVKENKPNIKHRIQLFGGEPILPITKDINIKILSFAEKNNIPVSIITNGSHVENYINIFKRFENTIDSVQITIDGIKLIHDSRRVYKNGKGTFDDIVNGLDLLLNTKIRQINLRVNINQYNINYLKELEDFLKSKKWIDSPNFRFDLAPVTDHTADNAVDTISEDEIIKKLNEKFPNYMENRLSMFRVISHIMRGTSENAKKDFAKYTYCEANRGQYYVYDPEGNIYACPEAIGNPQYAIGFYNDERVSLNKEAYSIWSNRCILNIDRCLDCEIAPFCGGGCAYAAIKNNGVINDPYCNNAKEVLREYINSIKYKFLEM